MLQVHAEVARMRELDEQLHAKTLEATMIAHETAPGDFTQRERARLERQQRHVERQLARTRADHERRCAHAVLPGEYNGACRCDVLAVQCLARTSVVCCSAPMRHSLTCFP